MEHQYRESVMTKAISHWSVIRPERSVIQPELKIDAVNIANKLI